MLGAVAVVPAAWLAGVPVVVGRLRGQLVLIAPGVTNAEMHR